MIPILPALTLICTRYIRKKGGKALLLFAGDLMVKVTETKKDDKLWKKIRPEIEKF